MQVKVHINDFLVPILGSRIIQSSGLPRSSYCLVCLNSPSLPVRLLPRLWAHSNYRVCADGGANRLYHGLSYEDRKVCIPNFIVGDLDSLEESVERYYKSCGTQVILDSDQETNDLDKSLSYLKTHLRNSNPSDQSVLVLGAFGGRFDQEMANIHTLYAWKDTFHRIVLVDDTSTGELLEANVSHRIIPMSSHSNPHLASDICEKVEEARYCGLVPLAQPVHSVTTTGLQWNLNGEPLTFGRRISTSNTIPSGSEVTVQCSEPILWTATYDIA